MDLNLATQLLQSLATFVQEIRPLFAAYEEKKGKNVRIVPATNRNYRGNAKGIQDGIMETPKMQLSLQLITARLIRF